MNRGVGLVVGAVIALGTVILYAREGWLPALAVVCTDGLLAAGWTVSAGLLGWVILRRLRMAAHGALLAATSVAIGLGIYSLAGLGLGLAGQLSRPVAIAMPVLSVILAAADVLLRQGNVSLQPATDTVERWMRSPLGWGALWWLAMPMLGIALVAACTPPGLLWPGDPMGYDVMSYHLQVPREWYEIGRIVPLEHNVFSYFPFNHEMQFLWAMHLRGGPWEGMYMAQFLSLTTMIAAVMAIAGAGPAGRANLGAVAAAVTPWVVTLSSVAYNEAGLILYGAVALAWALHAVRRTAPKNPHTHHTHHTHTNPLPEYTEKGQCVRAMALAGAAAGLASGVKLTAVPILAIAMPLGLIALAVASRLAGRGGVKERPTSRLLPGLAAFAILWAAAISPWLLRTWGWSGNPLFPNAARVLGAGHFTPQQVERFEIAHQAAAGQRSVGQRLLAANREIAIDWRYGYVLLPLAAIALALRLWRGGGDLSGDLLLAALLGALLAFWLGFTHLQSRFFVLGIPMAAMLVGRADWGRIGRAMLCVVLVMATGVAVFGIPLSLRGERAYGGLDQAIRPLLIGGGAFGATDYTPSFPDLGNPLETGLSLADIVQGQRPIALAGDAKAFWYQVPTSKLRYRTVFDVNIRGEQFHLVDAWLGYQPQRAGEYIVIWPGELTRFARTYWKIPPPPAAMTLAGDRPIVVSPQAR